MRFPTIPLDLRISLEREARRLAGYRQGGNIANQFMAMMTENDKVPFGVRLGEYLEREADPRLSRKSSIVCMRLVCRFRIINDGARIAPIKMGML